MICTFYEEHPEKPIATSLLLDSAPPMARPTIPKEPKRKRGRPSKGANKRGRNKSIRKIRAMPFVAPDVDVMLKPLIQKPCPYSQSNQHPVFFPRFPSQGFRGFSPLADDFSPIDRFFLSKFRKVFIDRAPSFPSSFSHQV